MTHSRFVAPVGAGVLPVQASAPDANDVVAQTELCNGGDAFGGKVLVVQTDLHPENSGPGGSANMLHNCFACRNNAGSKTDLLRQLKVRAQRDKAKTVEEVLRVPLPDGSFVRLPSMPLLPLESV